jgi:hypothetical protein
MNNKNIPDLISSIIIFVIVSILTFLGIYGNAFFRDFPILFDGAYRIFIGMRPFVDFSLFPIPVPFYLQAFFHKIFSPGLISMGAFSIFLSATLSIIFYFICKKHFSRFISIIFAALFHYSFIGILAYPWYNQIAYFFFTLNFFLLYFYMDNPKILSFRDLLLISTILTLLTAFSKMEIGLFHFVLLILYFIVFYYKKRKELFKFYIAPFTIIFIIITKIISSISIEGYGFSELLIKERLGLLVSSLTLDVLVYSFAFYILLAIIFFSLNNLNTIEKLRPKSKKLLGLIFLIVLFSTGILVLTGLPIQNRIFAIPLTAVLIYIFFKRTYDIDNIQLKKSTMKGLLIFTIFLIIISQFASIGNYQLVLFNSPTKQIHAIFSEKTGYERETFGCYKGALFEREDFEDLQILREYVENHKGDFIITGEYVFLYCDYQTKPPEKLPLWFHEGTTFNHEEFENIKSYINQEKPSLIVEQLIAPKDFRSEFREYLVEIGYNQSIKLTSEISDLYVFELSDF